MKLLIVLFDILSVASVALGEDFSRLYMDQKIVGGDKANIEDFPYQAALLRNGTQICGAAIIGPKTVLTAAHCVVPSKIPNIKQLSFRVGSSKWREGGERIAAKKIIINEMHRDCPTCFDYDTAIVELAREIKVPHAVPILLAEKNEIFPDGTLAAVTGWGTTSVSQNASAFPEVLRQVDVPLVNQTICRSAYGSILTNRFICAGFRTGGKDACNLDSGGPLALPDKLIGIVAFGKGCGDPQFPGVYSSVAKYRDWIRSNSGI